LKKGGGGTFDRLWSNLLEIRRSDLPCTIMVRLHVNPENAGNLAVFMQKLRRDFGDDSRFQLYPKLLSRWGGPNDPTLSVFDRSAGQRVIEDLKAQAARDSIPLYQPRAAATPVCYAARANSFLIRADGRVNKCTIALEAPENQVGRLTSDGRLLLNADRMVGWMRGLWSNSVEALKCPMTGLVQPSAPASNPG
jgi:uncharacterized protein